MRLKVERRWPKNDYIIGRLYMEGEFLCNTLEPAWRNNARNTAIPTGIYQVRVTYSEKFKRNLPLIFPVKDRSGIRIHRGNYPRDTQGCLLPGENTKKGAVLNSTKYEELIIKKLLEAEKRHELNTIEYV